MQISYNGCESGFVPVGGTCSKQIPTIDDPEPVVDIRVIVGAVVGILVLLVLVAAIYFKRLALEIWTFTIYSKNSVLRFFHYIFMMYKKHKTYTRTHKHTMIKKQRSTH